MKTSGGSKFECHFCPRLSDSAHILLLLLIDVGRFREIIIALIHIIAPLMHKKAMSRRLRIALGTIFKAGVDINSCASSQR